jgi:vanadium chloroperoxidase
MPASGFYAPFYGARSRCFAVNMRHHLDDAPPLDSPEDNPGHPASAQQGHCPTTHRDAAGGPAAFPHSRRDAHRVVLGLRRAKGIGTPPRLYSQIVRKIADGQANDVAANAWLFAGVNARHE